MANLVDALGSRTRKEYVLRTLLQKYPLPHEVVILDCPGTQSLMTTNALAASTHLLIPIQLEVKIKTVPELITWCSKAGEELELNPKPSILGIIPNNYNKEASLHRQNLEQLPAVARAMGIKLYPEIPALKYLATASAIGVPLRKYRPGDSICQSTFQALEAIASDIQNIMISG